MGSPQGQQYAQISDLVTYGVSQQFLNSPLFNQTNVPWIADSAYPANYLIVPATLTLSNMGLYFSAVSVTGIAGNTEPTWPTVTNAQVVDGGITWQCFGANNGIILNNLLLGASEYVDSYLRSKYGLPLQSWGSDIKRVTCWVAAYDAAQMRGFNPAIPAEDTFRIRYEQATKWLTQVAQGVISPDVLGSNNGATIGSPVQSSGPYVVSPTIGQQWNPNQTVGGSTRGTQYR
jgi:phage gp36-like protein